MDATGSGSSSGRGQPPDSEKQGFKSKRYRDKLRTEVKGLESLLPVDRSTVHRKLDSQTVYRLTIAYFRTKLFLQAAGLASELEKIEESEEKKEEKQEKGAGKTDKRDKKKVDSNDKLRSKVANGKIQLALSVGTTIPEAEMAAPRLHQEILGGPSLLQALDGFLLVVTSDGTILYVSRNILHHLGFNQVDLMLRCIYGIIHPDDQEELKMVLEQTLAGHLPKTGNNNQKTCCLRGDDQNSNATCRTISFLCRMKCFNGTTTGYLKMHCVGHMRAFPNVTKSQRTSNQVLFAFCRPFITVSTDPTADKRNNGFWTRHELDLRFIKAEDKIVEVLGYSLAELEGQSLYSLIHPEDLVVFRTCHKTLIHTDEIQTMYFRVEHRDRRWIWLHTRGKVSYKNSKKCAILFTHCPVREEDSTYIQQEAVLRQRYAVADLLRGHTDEDLSPQSALASLVQGEFTGAASRVPYGSLKDDPATSSLHDPHGPCPSSWHTTPDRHSPVFPHQPGDIRREIRDRRKRVLSQEDIYRQGSYVQGDTFYLQPGDTTHTPYASQASYPANKRFMYDTGRAGEYPAYETDYYSYSGNYGQNAGYVCQWDAGYTTHNGHAQGSYITGTNLPYSPVGYDVMNHRPDVMSSWPTYSDGGNSGASSYYSKVSPSQLCIQDGRKGYTYVSNMSIPIPDPAITSLPTSHVSDTPNYSHMTSGSGTDTPTTCKQMMVLPSVGGPGNHQVGTKIQYITL